MKGMINAKSLKEKLSSGNAPRVVDVRDGDAYAVAHIPGALHIPMQRLEASPVYVPSDRPVVLYSNMEDPTNALNDEALEILRERGLQIMVLEGGLRAWVQAGYPIESEGAKGEDNSI